MSLQWESKPVREELKRTSDEGLIEYLTRLSAIVGESNVVNTQEDGECVPYLSSEQREWNKDCSKRFPELKK